jgi:hypothetical protein
MATRTLGSDPVRRPDEPEERTSIVLSYGRDAVVGNSEPIFEALARRFPGRVLRSDDWTHDRTGILRTCRVVVPVIEPTPDGGFSRIDDAADPLQRELEVARAAGCEILPALVGGTGSEPVPMLLTLPPARKPVRITEQNFERGLNRLISRLDDLLRPHQPRRSLLESVTDRSALLLAILIAFFNYLLGAAPWIAVALGVGALAAFVIADLWLVPAIRRR